MFAGMFAESPCARRPAIVAPSQRARRAGPVESCIDYSVTSSKASTLFGEAAVERGSSLSPRFAVGVRLLKAPTKQMVTAQACPSRVATSRVHGPLPRPRAQLDGQPREAILRQGVRRRAIRRMVRARHKGALRCNVD